MRPPFEEMKDGKEFARWYWLKSEMVTLCRVAGLSAVGSKFELRDRIVHFLDTGEALTPQKKEKKSSFDWAKEVLTEETVITDSVSFGPNFRGFMKNAIGHRFSCTSEFMQWVKANPGKTLKDAIGHWNALESRKIDPSFRRTIADHNMYNQYLRDYMDHHPGAKLDDAKQSWIVSKQLPTKDGFVKYDPEGTDK